MHLKDLENNKLIQKVNSKAEAFFSNKIFQALLFLFLFAFLLFSSFQGHELIQDFYFTIFTFVFSLVAVYLMFKVKKFFPFVGLGAFLIFFSFFGQRFELIVEYNLIYFLGFGLISASLIYALIEQNKKFFWIALFLLFTASLVPLVTPQMLIGDERILLSNLTKLESGQFVPSDFGKHNYVNVSFVYFYYLVIIAKIFGTTVAEIFFILKFFFLLLIFLAFYLISTRFIDQKLAIFAVLIAFFPIQNLHLAPQMLGKFIIFLVFIYFYLKYFKQLNSRIILVVMMLLITYINLTTLYISIAVFAFFVAVFFLKKAVSRKTYFTDIIILFMFVVLIGTYSSSIDLFGLAENFSDVEEIKIITGTGETEVIEIEKETIVKEEDLSSRTNPFEEKKLQETSEGEIISEEKYEDILYIRRFVPFINTYVNQYGFERLAGKLLNYFLLVTLVLTTFFLYPKRRNIFVLSLAIFFLVLFLIHIQFPDGVHATLEISSLIFGVCIVLIYHKKPFYFIPLMLLALAIVSAPTLYTTSQYGEANQLLALEFSSKNLIGENPIVVTEFTSWNSNNYYSNTGFIVSCVDSQPCDFYLNGVFLRCDDFSRIGNIGTKVYENQYSKAFLIYSEDLTS